MRSMIGVMVVAVGILLLVSSPLLWHWLSIVLQDWSGLRPVPNRELAFGVAATCFFGGVIQSFCGVVFIVVGASKVVGEPA